MVTDGMRQTPTFAVWDPLSRLADVTDDPSVVPAVNVVVATPLVMVAVVGATLPKVPPSKVTSRSSKTDRRRGER